MRHLIALTVLSFALTVPVALGGEAAAEGLAGAKPYLGALFPIEIRDGRLIPNLERITAYQSEASKHQEPMANLISDIFRSSSGKAGLPTVLNQSACGETEIVRAFVRAGVFEGQQEYNGLVQEKHGLRRMLSGSLKNQELKLKLEGGAAEFTFLQQPDRSVRLEAQKDGQKIDLAAVDVTTLLKAHADKAQIFFLRPLADLGITLPPHKYLPPVMAVATGAFDPPPPEVAKKANELIAALSADDMDVRENACRELIALFPRAILHISQAAEKAQDAEVKSSLEKVVAAHPGIAKARAFVEKEKLHENREYLLDLLANVPFFKAAARARLTVLLGKDYGDDAAQWPK